VAVVDKLALVLGLLLSLSVEAKDYFGFNFDEDNPARVCQKAHQIFADCEQYPDGHVVVLGSGLLSIAADWLKDARISFLPNHHINMIHVSTHVLDEDERLRLLRHLQEDYDLSTLSSLNIVSLLDQRGVEWSIKPFCQTPDACRYDVIVRRDRP